MEKYAYDYGSKPLDECRCIYRLSATQVANEHVKLTQTLADSRCNKRRQRRDTRGHRVHRTRCAFSFVPNLGKKSRNLNSGLHLRVHYCTSTHRGDNSGVSCVEEEKEAGGTDDLPGESHSDVGVGGWRNVRLGEQCAQ
jgi:hypothetical protein